MPVEEKIRISIANIKRGKDRALFRAGEEMEGICDLVARYSVMGGDRDARLVLMVNKLDVLTRRLAGYVDTVMKYDEEARKLKNLLEG